MTNRPQPWLSGDQLAREAFGPEARRRWADQPYNKYMGLEIDASCGTKAAFCSSAHNEAVSTTQAGWTLGAGIEVMLRHNWLVRLEYRFADYGHVDHAFFANPPPDRVVMDESLKAQTLLVGLAYKLETARPVVAKH